MIVCVCLGITKKEIEDAINDDRLTELYEMGLSQHCGSCRSEIADLLEKEYEDGIYRWDR